MKLRILLFTMRRCKSFYSQWGPEALKILRCQDGVRIETCANAANCSYKQQHRNGSRSKRSLCKNGLWTRSHHLSCLLPSYVLLWGPLPFPWGLRNSSKWAAWKQCKSQDMPCTSPFAMWQVFWRSCSSEHVSELVTQYQDPGSTHANQAITRTWNKSDRL